MASFLVLGELLLVISYNYLLLPQKVIFTFLVTKTQK